MDFWASLEHKIFCKYHGAVPPTLREELREAAAVANQLDEKMERLHREVRNLQPGSDGSQAPEAIHDVELSEELLRAFAPSTNPDRVRPADPTSPR